MGNAREYDSFKTQEGEEIYLYQATNYDGEWNDNYARHPIYCPECGNALLRFTSKTSNHCAFLSSMPIPPNPEHNRDCSHRYKPISKRGAREFYNTCNHEQAVDKINACINLLKRRNFIPATGDENNQPHRPHLTVRRLVNGRERRCRLRTRSFYSIYKLEEEDIGFPIVFYGRVYLSVDSLESKSMDHHRFNVIKVHSIYKENRLLQSLYFGDNTINGLEKEHAYLFAMIGVPERNGNYINVKFYNRDYTLYRIEEPDQD
jgi:hypothetical protein